MEREGDKKKRRKKREKEKEKKKERKREKKKARPKKKRHVFERVLNSNELYFLKLEGGLEQIHCAEALK